ncbi:hypothetical protein GOB07_31675 [Sinorhizobium meliloti]|uniref:transcriptional regulator n=1 Tax=Rhizobium meliloti TaxID=382 RepID=UPI000FD42B01|nr:YdaS family helix-turn-helix protein [Sinorhizobium meliloti]MDW9372246.1 hypothetical protein [Sinorhizobium meliloti]MDW9401136.1 hypothetical protein [Sinorhizobium meliloti]MDW9540496.1 hypothetical protein [Sinorhizobium meliloti]MDW9551369.1 hypothetical protein [Sinorhizobium meliloti]MDW9615503.1 hypothetical protein [Sinorhizobium meliloti]
MRAKKIYPPDPRTIACEAAKTRAGGTKFLARRLGVSRQLVHAWKIVPAKHALRVEKETGISCHILRPDVFGPPATKETAE